MHFLCVTQRAKADIYGQEYQLKPLDPKIENIEDILVTDNTSASELLSRHPEFLAGLSMDIDNLRGFPKIVNQLSDIGPEGKVLIMRNGGIGDHIMFLPALRIFREVFPSNVEIILSAQREKHPLFHHNSNITQLLPMPLRLTTMLEADYLIDFSGRKGLYDMDSLHMTDSCLKFLGIDYEKIKDKTPELAWDKNTSPIVSRLFQDAKKKNPRRPFVLLNWRASNILRDIPPERLLFMITEFKDVQFVVAQQNKYSAEVLSILEGYGDNLINCTDHIATLEDYIAAIANCDAVIATDTSTGHLAEALGKHSIILYGPTRDDLWIRYYKKSISVRANYSGKSCQSPCGMIKEMGQGCPEAQSLNSHYSPCLLSISENSIINRFHELLEKLFL